jgi:hypothetical protein
LRRRLLYLGLALFLAGTICLAVGAVNLNNITLTPVSESLEKWELVGNLKSGTTYVLYIESGDEWGEPFANGAFVDPQPVNVTLTSPDGGDIRLQAFFYGLAPTSPLYREGTPPTIVSVVYQSTDSSSLDVDTSSSSRIRFTVKKNDNFTARVLEPGSWVTTPPNYMMFFEEVTLNKQAYTLLVASGGLLAVIGLVTLIFTALAKGKTRRGKTRK